MIKYPADMLVKPELIAYISPWVEVSHGQFVAIYTNGIVSNHTRRNREKVTFPCKSRIFDNDKISRRHAR